MPKPSHRETLLNEGLKGRSFSRLFRSKRSGHRQGRGSAAGVVHHHFTSKEAFAQEVLDLYFSLVRGNIDKTLRNDSLPPLDRAAGVARSANSLS